MPVAVRRVAALVAACGLLLALPGIAVAHVDPYEPVHTHTAVQQEGGTGNGPVVAIAVVGLMLASAVAVVGLKRAGAR